MNGFMIGNKDVLIKWTKGETTLLFDQFFELQRRLMSDIKMVPILNQVAKLLLK
jgi:hypothetical protein